MTIKVWKKCLDKYKDVDEFAEEHFGDYYNWYVGFGDGKRTDVREWYEQSMMDSKCLCKECRDKNFIHIGMLK